MSNIDFILLSLLVMPALLMLFFPVNEKPVLLKKNMHYIAMYAYFALMGIFFFSQLTPVGVAFYAQFTREVYRSSLLWASVASLAFATGFYFVGMGAAKVFRGGKEL